MVPYFVEIFGNDQDSWRSLLADAVQNELRSLGVNHTLNVELVDPPNDREPSVGLYLAGSRAVEDPGILARLEASVASGRVIIPVVEALDDFNAVVPECLRLINGFGWTEPSPEIRLARLILEELGIEERQRRAFISHRRHDGLAAAEQLHDHLSHNGFVPFIDRFHIPAGANVQNEIADSLEDCALVVLLETPLAHESPWVFYEVNYGVGHQLGVHIVTWPGSITMMPGTDRLLRQVLEPGDLTPHRGYDTFTDEALGKITREIEAEHARALVSRRRYLLRGTEEAARDAGRASTPLPGWRLFVSEPPDGQESPESSRSWVVQVSARLPTVYDLYSLDHTRTSLLGMPPGLLVHAARTLSEPRRRLLAWAGDNRDLALLPENAVGGFWA